MADREGAPVFKLFGTRIVMEANQVRKEEEEQASTQAEPESNSTSTTDQKGTPTAAAAAATGGLPCPRCKSKETKFCYFNNYNVNQPRHFCRGCHRYWTAGGALRNVPVGAGRRKARPSSQDEGGVFGYSPGLEGVMVQQWLISHDGFPAKRPNNTLPDIIR